MRAVGDPYRADAARRESKEEVGEEGLVGLSREAVGVCAEEGEGVGEEGLGGEGSILFYGELPEGGGRRGGASGVLADWGAGKGVCANGKEGGRHAAEADISVE